MSSINLTEWLSKIERSAVDFIAVFAPWLGPIPSAYLVGVSVHEYLEWHILIAVIAAIAVESIGVVSIVIALRLYEWNETKRKSDPAAPFALSIITVIVYFVVTIGLTVLLDVFPELARFAPAVFPLLAAVGAVNIAVKNGQQRREAAKTQPKGTPARREVRQEKRQEKRQDAGDLPTDYRLLTAEQRYELAHLTRVERNKMMPNLAARTRRAWHERLDKVAAQNGSFIN
jgi:hypothetical protein